MYLREIIFVTDVAVLTIETAKLVFKPVSKKQFHFLKALDDAFEIRDAFLKYGTSKKKVTSRDAKEDVDKVCIKVQKTPDNSGGKPTRGFSPQHKISSALNYAQDFGTK